MTKKLLKLAIFDIDGTLRRVPDPWFHLHKFLGLGKQAGSFFNSWQEGKITYKELCRLDASLWKGFTRDRIVDALKIDPIRKGARNLVKWFNSNSIPCVGISSGLSVFNNITAKDLGIEKIISNDLLFDDNICIGKVNINVNEESKIQIFKEVLSQYSVTPKEVVVFGDGPGDISLLMEAELGIAICPLNDTVRRNAKYVVEAEPINTAINIVMKHFYIGETVTD